MIIEHIARLDIYVHNDPQEEDRLLAIESSLDLITEDQETIMIDTKRILAEVARERTELASWKEMSSAKDKIIGDQAEALKKAIADNDPVAMAQVQADLETAANNLSADNDEAEAAIKANTPPVREVPAGTVVEPPVTPPVVA